MKWFKKIKAEYKKNNESRIQIQLLFALVILPTLGMLVLYLVVMAFFV